MNIVEKPIGELIPYKNNPRYNDNAVNDVAKSIELYGFKVPIVIDKNNVIVCGHTRVKAAERLGMQSVPCVVADDLTDEQIKAFRIADNKVSEGAVWDFEKLEIELEGLDFSEFDFGIDFDFLNGEENEGETEPSEQEEFSIDEIEEVNGYDKNDDNREYFTTAFTFPTSQKEQIMRYLRQHKQEITEDIIKKAVEKE